MKTAFLVEKSPVRSPAKKAADVAFRSLREVPKLSDAEQKLFSGLTANAGFTLANAAKMYKKN